MARSRKIDERISVRGPAASYIAAGFVGSFFSALSFYLDVDILGYLLAAAAFVLLPMFAVTDRFVFNGRRIYRSGVIPRTWAYLLGKRYWLKIRDVEQVETQLLPALKRGGRIYFRYRSTVRGGGLEFAFASGGARYRSLVGRLYAAVPEEILDTASIELRDYLAESATACKRAKDADIPPPDVLEPAFRRLAAKGRRRPGTGERRTADGLDKVAGLRLLGNQLRLSGSLLQAMESFRRAASILPEDPWLLFDFARCIQSYAGAERSAVLERKAAAMMRLAERRAGDDGRLLACLGESYYQMGEWNRARVAFRKAADAVGDQFRAIRGMAEIALRDGKLAHVVHNFGAASRSAESPAARRWSRGEAEYFARLNDDDEYMEMELGRINLLDALARWRRSTFRLALVGLPFIVLGLYFGDAVTTDAGWILSGGMVVLWSCMSIARKAFTDRIAPELLTEE